MTRVLSHGIPSSAACQLSPGASACSQRPVCVLGQQPVSVCAPCMLGSLWRGSPGKECQVLPWNPCGVGTCVNLGVGEYGCICPPGYKVCLTTKGKPTCVPGQWGGQPLGLLPAAHPREPSVHALARVHSCSLPCHGRADMGGLLMSCPRDL